MRTTGNRRAVIVGIFTLIGVAILVATILLLGTKNKTFSRSVTVKTYFANVNGLKKGNNIWYTGVKVGIVREVKIISSGRVEVNLDMDYSSRKFIHKDARAKLGSDGFIGAKIVEIYGGTAGTPTIEAGTVLRTDSLFSTDAMLKTLGNNNDNLLEITNNLTTITDRMVAGEGSFGKLLTDETMMNQINHLTLSLNKSADQLQEIIHNAARYSEKLNEPGTLANDLVSDTVIFSKLRQLTTQLQQVADSSQIAVNNLKQAGNTLDKGLKDKKAPLGMLLSDKEAAQHVKITLQNLESASKKLDEDLEALQHNFLFRRFFKNKKKQEKSDTRVVLDTLIK